MKAYLPFILVFVFICFDFFTGWVKAIATSSLDSSIMRKGLYNKLGEILSVIFGYLCEYAFQYLDIDIKIPIAGSIATYIVIMETASIIENISVISPQMANGLKQIFDNKKLNIQEEGKHVAKKDESANSD